MYRVRTTFQSSAVGGGPWLNTLYFEGLGFPQDAQSAADAVAAFWGNVDSLMHSSVTWSQVPEVAQVIDNGTITAMYPITAASGTGSQAATQILPPATQCLCRLLTGTYVSGRQLRGKIYIPGLTESANGQGVVDGSIQGTLQGYLNTLVNVAAPNPLVVWSPTYATHVDVTAGQVVSKWAVLRSRKD